MSGFAGELQKPLTAKVEEKIRSGGRERLLTANCAKNSR
jgi:hypothetical protein